ncbi:MAG: hypothetical protein ABIK65_13470 [Candidatus Eisenbacteria bacterium]
MKKRILAGLGALLLMGSGCTFFGLFGPKGPETFSIVFSNETVGELKPCG